MKQNGTTEPFFLHIFSIYLILAVNSENAHVIATSD